MGEGNLERRMQILSLEEEKGLAVLMKSQKIFQSHREGLKGQQGLHMVEGVDVGSNKCKSPLPHLENCSTFGVGLA
jgi:hypothetical protein